MKSILTTACALLLALALATPALAEGGGREGKGAKGRKGKRPPLGKLFAKFDKDGSGSLTSDEVPERLWERIVRADADGDGAVTKAELKAARKGHGKGRRSGKGDGSAGA